MSRANEITRLLGALRSGNREVVDRIAPLLYSELRRLAAAYFRNEQPGNALQPTAPVHEAYLRLIGQDDVQWQNRSHFIGVAAQVMRRILVDQARWRHAAKRLGHQLKFSLEDTEGLSRKGEVDLMALDEVLNHLSRIDPRQARIVELRFFRGLSAEETADMLGVSAITVKREWSVAKAWLRREMTRAGTTDG